MAFFSFSFSTIEKEGLKKEGYEKNALNTFQEGTG